MGYHYCAYTPGFSLTRRQSRRERRHPRPRPFDINPIVSSLRVGRTSPYSAGRRWTLSHAVFPPRSCENTVWTRPTTYRKSLFGNSLGSSKSTVFAWHFSASSCEGQIRSRDTWPSSTRKTLASWPRLGAMVPCRYAPRVEAPGRHPRIYPEEAPVFSIENWVCSYIDCNDNMKTAAEGAKYRIGKFCFRSIVVYFHAFMLWARFENVPFPMVKWS